MKIVSVMTTRSRGGAEFAAVELLDALCARGHEAVMLSDQPEIGRDTAVAVRPLEIGPKLSARTWPGLALRWPRLRRELVEALRREAPYDVLLVHYKKEQLLAGGLPPELRPALAWCEWGPVPYPMRRGLPRRAYLRAARDVAAVLAISQDTAENLADVGVDPARIHVVPNAMRADEIDFTAEGRARVRAEQGIPADALVVGCISRFNHKKRNDVVVDAVAMLDDPRVHLVMAGDGEMEDDLRARAAALGDRAHFLPTPGRDVADVLSAFDIDVFCPSPTEGQPRAIILGMLARRPVLSTGPEGAAAMLRTEFGAIAEPEHDAAALAALLRPYLDDPERAEREGEAARRHAETTYGASVIAERVERLLLAARKS